jgi:hypothetical protein
MRLPGVLLAALALSLAGCGASRLAIQHPAEPIYAKTGCHGVTVWRYYPPRREVARLSYIRCPGRFDARAILGLTLLEGERVAAAHGASVRALKQDGYGPIPTLDEAPGRVDVDTTEGIVTRIDEIG